jgi:hypothetical protein
MTALRRLVALLAAVTLALGLLAGCGEETATEESSGNTSSTEFATELMHRDAALLNLLDVTLARDLSPTLVATTEQLRLETVDRMEVAADLLEESGDEVPMTVRDHAAGHSSDAHVPDLAAMTTGDDLQRLGALEGRRFEAELVTLLTTSLEAIRALAAGHDGARDGADLAEQTMRSCDTALETLA